MAARAAGPTRAAACPVSHAADQSVSSLIAASCCRRQRSQSQHTCPAHLRSSPFHSPRLPLLLSILPPASSSLPLPPANRTSGQLFPAVSDAAKGRRIFARHYGLYIYSHSTDTTPRAVFRRRGPAPDVNQDAVDISDLQAAAAAAACAISALHNEVQKLQTVGLQIVTRSMTFYTKSHNVFRHYVNTTNK